MANDNGVTVQAVQFMDDMISITYAETRLQGKRVGHGETLYIQMDLVVDDVQEVLDTLREMIDKALEDVRNPEPTLRGEQRGSLTPPEEVATD